MRLTLTVLDRLTFFVAAGVRRAVEPPEGDRGHR
jgi:hypothetical protein